MTMTMDELMKVLDMQEDILQLRILQMQTHGNWER